MFRLLYTKHFNLLLQLDDAEDAEMIGMLVESHPPVELMAVSTQHPPGIAPDSLVTSMQMFTRVWRTKVPPILTHNILSQYFDKLLQVRIYSQE